MTGRRPPPQLVLAELVLAGVFAVACWGLTRITGLGIGPAMFAAGTVFGLCLRMATRHLAPRRRRRRRTSAGRARSAVTRGRA